MKKSILLLIIFPLFTAFRPATETWKAVLKLEGKGKNYELTSHAVYGGLQAENKKIFLFGKNHMFLNAAEPEAVKVFHDLCVTNAMQQFQFEVMAVPAAGAQVKDKMLSGNISMRKKKAQQARYQEIPAKGKSVVRIENSGSLQDLGFTLTPEAAQLFTGKYSLTFISEN
jgi:hypothetical protein